MWAHLGIFFALSLLVCLCGFKKYVYFMSIGYGFSVAIIGVAMAVMSLMGIYTITLPNFIQFALFVIYGFRLSGFLLIREIKNATYRKTLAEATGKEVPIFVKFFMWVFMGVLYVAQTSGVAFRLFNGKTEGSVVQWVGIAISAFGIILEAVADKQKSAQKAKRPDMVATEQLYKIVRCPNYFGEILFWTGVTVSALDCLVGFWQWFTVILAYICIVFIMFNGAQRLEKRQMARYGSNKEYNDYADKTPIIIPLLPIYHLNKKK